MKKTYITPALEAVKIDSVQLMAGSEEMGVNATSIDTEGDILSNKYQGGFLWEEDNAE